MISRRAGGSLVPIDSSAVTNATDQVINLRPGSIVDMRGGTVAGVHEVSFFGQDEEVTLTHRATSRQIFVNGALAAAQKLVTREPGFYTFDKVMFA